MKHIGKTNNNELIVNLKIEEINELMMLINSARCHYIHKMKNRPKDIGLKLMDNDANKWWNALYDLRELL